MSVAWKWKQNAILHFYYNKTHENPSKYFGWLSLRAAGLFLFLLHSSSGLTQTSITFVNCLTFIFWRICNLFYHPVDELTIFQAFVNFSNFLFHIGNMLPSLISFEIKKLTLHNITFIMLLLTSISQMRNVAINSNWKLFEWSPKTYSMYEAYFL